MKILRFMSNAEFDKYKKGDVLKNDKKHSGFTDSIGFCFLNYEKYEPEYAYKFLSGIVSEDVCVVFETDKTLTKHYGQYAEPYGSFFDTFIADEYCINEYNKDDFKLIKYCYDYDKKHWEDEEWTWIIEREEENE